MKITYRFFIANISLLVFINLFSPAVNADQLYKWVDEQGKVTYQSSPPPESAIEVERSKISLSVAGDPEETEEVTENVPVKFFTKPDCPSCDEARIFFEDNDVSFEEIDLTENETEAEALQKNLGHNNAPTMTVGGTSVSGFNKKTFENILSKAGYTISTEE